MARDKDIGVTVTADTSQLKKGLSDASNSVDEFSKKTGGVIGSLGNDISSGLSKMGVAFTGIGAGLAVTGGVLTSLINSSRDYVSQLNEVSRSTGVSVTDLQKLSSAFGGLGLDIQKFGDINKDTLDHLGDAFRDGSGPAEDLIAYGVNLQGLNKYLNQTDGGIKAVIHTFYEMQKAGKTVAETTNAMETLASDSSHIVPILRQFSSETEALAYIQSQNAAVSNEAAASYAEFDRNVTQLSNNVKGTIADALNPLVSVMNDVYTASNQKPHEAGLFEDINERIKTATGSLKDFLDIWGMLRQAGALNYQGAALQTGSMDNGKESPYAKQKERLQGLVGNLQNDLSEINKPNGGYVNKDKEAAAAKSAADKALREQEAAARKSQAITERNLNNRIKAQRGYEQLLSSLTSDENARQLSEFDRQQKEIIKSIYRNAQVLGISPKELLDRQKNYSEKTRNDMVNSMLGITDPNEELRSKLSLGKSGQLNDQQKGALGGQIQEEAMQGLGYEGWKSDSTIEREKTQIDERQRLQEEAANALITNAQDRERALNTIQAKADSDRLALTQNNVKSTMSLYEGLTGELGTALSNAFGEGSAAAKAAFAVQSGLAIAQTIMNIQVALSNALALPFPLNIPEYLKVGIMGASIISRVKNAASGQAHGGIDEVPGGASSESTWILKGGERVLQPEANKSLTKFLDNTEKNGGTGGDITINSPMIVQGSISDEKQFSEMLKKHRNVILQEVRQSQKRNS
ncbi:TPA: hypothetical protein ACXRYW_005342 [Klebsiella variicola subsp. variicola]